MTPIDRLAQAAEAERKWRRFLSLYEDPVPKPRARVTKTGHAYTPSHAQEAERRIRQAWVEKHGADPWDGPLALTVIVRLRMPQSLPKKHRATARPTKRPDLDNFLKTVLDALNGVAWKDDAQVVDIATVKNYGEVPGWEIEVMTEWPVEVHGT